MMMIGPPKINTFSVNRRIEELVAKRVEEELEKRKDDIEKEVQVRFRSGQVLLIKW